jgi:hypothetical protein
LFTNVTGSGNIQESAGSVEKSSDKKEECP